jgi:hypothetical protein
VDEWLRFVALLPEGDKMAGLFRKSGVSRGIGYQSHRRGRDIGPEALTEHSLTPSLDRPDSGQSNVARHRRPMAAPPRRKRLGNQRVRSGGLKTQLSAVGRPVSRSNHTLRLKALEDENARLKQLLAESLLDRAALEDLLSRKW